ncbi:metallophosphoesterase [Ruegeria lacuscaerulensis]|uniref:metallophosphoesterase n=1 Tax=Ruegeria lacuscaerulensis TaxID=55218 RepID=UPI001F19CF7C|nr:metallophosphoesterase [Ruegeria lacuscaerulensis]
MSQVPHDAQIILVGDYIDRGEHSSEVLRMMQACPEFMCLMGNHEQMLLRFLADPKKHGRQWLRNGGLQTLASFRIPAARPEMTSEELTKCRDSLRRAMGDELVGWIADFKTSFHSGNIFVSHAGADPTCRLDQQSEHDLLWGNKHFQTKDRKDGQWVVHGHTIVSRAAVRGGRIAVDTGAFATGVLSAVYLDGSEPEFLTALG